MYIAYLTTECSPVVVEKAQHVVSLDVKTITMAVFRLLFYPSDSFSITAQASLGPLISFKQQTIESQPFSLSQTILANASTDLHLPQSCFTPDSVMELTHELLGLNTLYDLRTKVVTALSWSNVQEMFENTITIGVLFKVPTIGVQPTLIEFNYRIQ
jgi:hypothetical protein